LGLWLVTVIVDRATAMLPDVLVVTRFTKVAIAPVLAVITILAHHFGVALIALGEVFATTSLAPRLAG
jgi:hypothetical protein